MLFLGRFTLSLNYRPCYHPVFPRFLQFGCTHGQCFYQPFAGLLNSLVASCCPWSHITVDFVTGFPLLDGNTAILTVVDHFSKAIHFIPLTITPFHSRDWGSPGLTCFHLHRFHSTKSGELERCVFAQNSASWSVFLTWVEYSHNLVFAATGLSPFIASLGYPWGSPWQFVGSVFLYSLWLVLVPVVLFL